MTALTAAAVTTRVSTLLQDPTNIRWTVTELLTYISDAQREICVAKLDECVKTATTTLVVGTRQVLPDDGVALLDIPRNMGVGGNTPGRAPRVVTREILDAQNPNWHFSTAAAEVIHYTFDPQNQKVFYVYPPQPASGQGSLELIYAAEPLEVSLGGSLSLSTVWLPVVVNYTLFRCYSKDAEYAANATLANTYASLFAAQLSARSNAVRVSDVNRNSAGVNPNIGGASG